MSQVGNGARVLVVDGDRAVLEMLQIRLDLAGYHPLAARSGPAALEIIKSMHPAALVLDLAIPEIDTFELLSILQKDRTRPMSPTLVMGKRLGIDEIKRAATFGVRSCMVKPFSGADLLDRMEKIMKPVAPVKPAQVASPASCGAGPRVAQSGNFFL
jgi:DNA-binding response OmpR family regulator